MRTFFLLDGRDMAAGTMAVKAGLFFRKETGSDRGRSYFIAYPDFLNFSRRWVYVPCHLRFPRPAYSLEKSGFKMMVTPEQKIVIRPDRSEVLLNSRPVCRKGNPPDFP
tara:strand:+ start:31 stop:357 length:327 start_codon:yes stop_codon:yes gene_type:complete